MAATAVENVLAAIILRSLKDQPHKWKAESDIKIASSMSLFDHSVDIFIQPIEEYPDLEITVLFEGISRSIEKQIVTNDLEADLVLMLKDAYGLFLFKNTGKINDFLSDKVIADWVRERMANDPNAFKSGNFSS